MKFIVDNEVIKGHDKYLLIMNLISNPRVDVSTDQDFQGAYSGYYFPAQVGSVVFTVTTRFTPCSKVRTTKTRKRLYS